MTLVQPAATSPLSRLFHCFDVEALGEGDLCAGMNVLAAKCISLANLFPAGTRLVTPDDRELAVGMSFAVAGGLTTSLVSERVFDPIANIQNNLVNHLAAEKAHHAAELAAIAPQERLRVRPPKPTGSPEMNKYRTGLDLYFDPAGRKPFVELLVPPKDRGPDEFALNPAVYLEAGSAADLMSWLRKAHRHQLFVRADLSAKRGAGELGDVLQSLMRGMSVPGAEHPVHVRGHVAVTCTSAGLTGAVREGEGLLPNLLWLTDGSGGGLASRDDRPGCPPPIKTHLTYCQALKRAWTARLDYRNAEPPVVRYDWTRSQAKWVTYLRRLEPRCPGLTLAARPLLASLVFGLSQLTPPDMKPPWGGSAVLELAVLLVERMTLCRERIVERERDERIFDLALRLLPKLVAGPLDARGLVRKTNNLPIADCRSALELLERLGTVRAVSDGRCELLLSAEQAVEKIRDTQLIDV